MRASNKRVADLERRVKELEEVVNWLAAEEAAATLVSMVPAWPDGSEPKAGADLARQAVLAWASGKLDCIGRDSEQTGEDIPF